MDHPIRHDPKPIRIHTPPPVYYPCTLYNPVLDTFYTYNYLYKTKEECDAEQSKLDSYKSTYIAPTSKPVPQTTTPKKSTEDIQKCKDAVREKYDNLIRGCYVGYQGSAANMCASGYQSQSGPEWAACEK